MMRAVPCQGLTPYLLLTRHHTATLERELAQPQRRRGTRRRGFLRRAELLPPFARFPHPAPRGRAGESPPPARNQRELSARPSFESCDQEVGDDTKAVRRWSGEGARAPSDLEGDAHPTELRLCRTRSTGTTESSKARNLRPAGGATMTKPERRDQCHCLFAAA